MLIYFVRKLTKNELPLDRNSTVFVATILLMGKLIEKKRQRNSLVDK